MRTRSKIGIGCLAIILAIVAAGAWFWFSREPRPIVVDDAGPMGERVEIVAVSKSELPGAEQVRARLETATGRDVLAIRAATGQGLDRLLAAVGKALNNRAAEGSTEEKP